MEKIAVGKVGFDVVTCAGFGVSEKEILELKKRVESEKVFDAEVVTVTNLGAVHIKESTFEFFANRSNLDHKLYARLRLRAAQEDGNNLLNMSTDEVKQKLYNALHCLKNKYGLSVYANQVEIHSCELNRTFVPSDDFATYKRVFALFAMVVLSNSGKKYDVSIQRLKGAFQQQGMKCEKGTYAYRIYDKAAEMEAKMDGITFDKRLMRVELIYKEAQPIQTDFATNKLFEFTDVMLEHVFKSRMEKIEIAIYKYLDEKYQYKGGATGRNMTVANIVMMHNDWAEVLAALSSYEADYGVPCMLDCTDMRSVLERLVDKNMLNQYSVDDYYNGFMQRIDTVPQTLALLDGQRELLCDFFTKAKNCLMEEVKMRN